MQSTFIIKSVFTASRRGFLLSLSMYFRAGLPPPLLLLLLLLSGRFFLTHWNWESMFRNKDFSESTSRRLISKWIDTWCRLFKARNFQDERGLPWDRRLYFVVHDDDDDDDGSCSVVVVVVSTWKNSGALMACQRSIGSKSSIHPHSLNHGELRNWKQKIKLSVWKKSGSGLVIWPEVFFWVQILLHHQTSSFRCVWQTILGSCVFWQTVFFRSW